MGTTSMYTNPANATSLDVATIAAAKKTIDFAAYSLTDAGVCAAILGRAQAGVTIRIYLDRSEVEAEARGNPAMPTSALRTLMGVPGITIKVKQSIVLMHLKSYCTDAAWLRDGSANFSPQGEGEQDNSATLTSDPDAIARFALKFTAMWNRPDNMSIEQAVETGQSYAAHRGHSH